MSGQHHGTVVVVGQGYVGLPVAMRAVEKGYRVVGLDADQRRVAQLAAGDSYVGDISSKELQTALDSGRYLPTADYQEAAGFDIAVVTVPTPLKESLPDLSFIEASARALAPHVSAGSTVILESTTYPGTTEELFAPLLSAGGVLVAGRDFHVGYSPERIDPGNAKYGFVTTPKVVSGLSAECLAKVQGFYDTLVNRTVPVKTPKEAELTKLLENTFRHVNIALVNELAIFAHQLGIDIWESIDAASTKPFGYMRFTPGPGVGGHCLPVDPSYLSWQVRKQLGQNFRFVELANDVNDHMPEYVVSRLITLLNDQLKSVRGSRILLVGLAYKANTGDIRESPSLKLIDLLFGLGAELIAVDDLIETHRWPQGVTKVSLSDETVESIDLAVLITAHSGLPYELLETAPVPVLDTQNRLKGANIVML
ncbi:nucleotide sugar dehydrogenase [Sanguibacter suarezii]|uniref:nucleotide sugar dehydrogenase n=1 Tax=Sanguibacter suarezii TaxID=60921 RepID=UPI000AB3C7A8|nr:nucleotide sugar dehydrogenase [Sanguibacter suarezii]